MFQMFRTFFRSCGHRLSICRLKRGGFGSRTMETSAQCEQMFILNLVKNIFFAT